MNRHVFAVAFFVAVCASVTHAAEPVGAPNQSISACQFHRIEGGQPDAQSIEWDVTQDDVDVYQNAKNRSIVIWVPSPRRLVIFKKVIDKAGKQTTEVIDLRITGDAPKPVAPVTPDVKPEPDVKPLSPFAVKVRDEAMKIASDGRAKQAKVIANALRSVRSKIVAGAIDTSKPANVVHEIGEQTGTQPAAWRAWVSWWNRAGKEEFQKSEKMTPGNWLDLLDSTIEGLEAVK